jgi:hypothetical protein
MGVLEDTDWAALTHAYGRATDTPDHLRALLADDDNARAAAMEHLWSAIIHQGTPWLATPKVALFVAEHLADPRVEPIRGGLLAFLSSVIEAPLNWDRVELERWAQHDIDQLLVAGDDSAIYEDEDAANAIFARSVLACVEVTPLLVEHVLAQLSNSNPKVRVHAADAAAKLAQTAAPIDRAKLFERLRELASRAERDERCAHVLAIGGLGEAPREFLDDPTPSVRACAALAPALAQDARAIDELIHSVEREDIDSWFVDRPPQFKMRPRFSVVKELVKRVPDFDRLIEAAVRVARTTQKFFVDFEWGPLLVAAVREKPGTLSAAARRYLAALVDNAELWDARFGNAGNWFREAGLPYDRDACARLVRD